jgi:hypothetical protein
MKETKEVFITVQRYLELGGVIQKGTLIWNDKESEELGTFYSIDDRFPDSCHIDLFNGMNGFKSNWMVKLKVTAEITYN